MRRVTPNRTLSDRNLRPFELEIKIETGTDTRTTGPSYHELEGLGDKKVHIIPLLLSFLRMCHNNNSLLLCHGYLDCVSLLE